MSHIIHLKIGIKMWRRVLQSMIRRHLSVLLLFLLLYPAVSAADYFCGGGPCYSPYVQVSTGSWDCVCCAPSGMQIYCNGTITHDWLLRTDIPAQDLTHYETYCTYDNLYICNTTGRIVYQETSKILGQGSCSMCPTKCEPHDDKCCKLGGYPVGSSANVSNGNLSHSQTLFTLPNSKILGDFKVTYNSLDSNSVPLGVGWTHNYNVNLVESNGSVVVTESDGKRGILHYNGSFYTPETSPWPRLVKNTDGTYLLTHKDGLKYYFSATGKVTSIVDRNSNTTTFLYDANDNLVTVTEPSGRVIPMSYNTSNLINSIIDPNGNIHYFTYANNTLVGIETRTPTGEALNWTYTYDPTSFFMLTKTDPKGFTTTYTYDNYTWNRLLTSTDPEGKSKTITYGTNTTTVTEKDGGVWTYKYDPTLAALIEKTDPLGGTTAYFYDSNQHLASEQDPDGNTTSYTYDSDNNITSETDPLNQTTSYTYNSFGQQLTVTDPMGNVTTYAYDSNGNMTSTQNPKGAVTVYQYDANGNVTQITNPLNQITTITYDQYNNPVTVTDHTGAITQYTCEYPAAETAGRQSQNSNSLICARSFSLP